MYSTVGRNGSTIAATGSSTYIVHTFIHTYSNRNGLCNVSQILSNKMHSLFVSIAKAYASEQTNMLIEAHSFLKEVLGSAIYL